MAKFDVAEIKKEAIKTRDNCKGRKGSGSPMFPVKIENLRIYISKVLFLCREIEKLQKKLDAKKIRNS